MWRRGKLVVRGLPECPWCGFEIDVASGDEVCESCGAHDHCCQCGQLGLWDKFDDVDELDRPWNAPQA
jgi:hypothetical protein